MYIIAVTAPTSLRYKNFKHKYKTDITLKDFLILDDNLNFNSKYGSRMELELTSSNTLLHNNSTLEDFLSQLSNTDFMNESLLRPDWDRYFMQISLLVAKRSNCFRRAVGATLVKDKRIVATGYNGTPFGITNCNKGGCPRCSNTKGIGTDLDKCICIHAEENAIIESGISHSKGCTIYTTTFPCLLCSKTLVQAGVVRVVYYKDYTAELSKELLIKAGIKIDKVDPFVLTPYLKI